MGNIPKILHSGKVTIGDKELSCAVLDNGERILTNTAVFQAFERPRKGKPSEEYRLKNVPAFITANNLKPYIDAEFKDNDYSIEYIRSGRQLTGYKAEILPRICDIYLSARDDGVLTEKQKQLSVVSDILMRSLAKVGIVALIDEATGYQYERDVKALQELFSEYIAKEFLPWVKTFDDEFYIQMFRLRGWDYNGSRFKTSYAGQLTNFLVYRRLPEGVLDELKKNNPILTNGYRKYRLHQGLSKDKGYSHLKQHLSTVITMMKGFDTWGGFEPVFRKSFGIPDNEKC